MAGEAGKGDKTRPMQISYEEYAQRWDDVFGKPKKPKTKKKFQKLNACPTKCCYCQNGENSGFDSYICNLGLETTPWWSLIDCKQFDPIFDKIQSKEGFVAQYKLLEKEFVTPWVDYKGKKLICPKCGGIDWAVETQGIDWGEETCKKCGFTSSFLSYDTFIGDYIDNDTFLTEWCGDNSADE